MSNRLCPGCNVKIVRGDPSLASCVFCKSVYHQSCLSLTVAGSSLLCANCSVSPITTSSVVRARKATAVTPPPATSTLPISPTIYTATDSATPAANQYPSKRRASTPSPSITPSSKAHCASPAAVLSTMSQGNGTSTPYSQLDADDAIGAALRDAPPHMQIIYNLLKTSHDSNAASLADNSRVMADTMRTLSNLITCVDELATRVDVIQQNQHALGARLDADLSAVRADISRANDANRAALNRYSLEDPREIIVRGIPQAVQLEPLPLSLALLTALNLPHHATLVVGWRAWSPPARPDHSTVTTPNAFATLRPAAPLRALVFTLASPEARDDILCRTSGLRNLTCETIFGAGGDAKLSVNALWPDPVHRLLKHAIAKHKQLGHLRPIVKNLTVFMRPTKNGPLLLVTCEADIDALTPRQS